MRAVPPLLFLCGCWLTESEVSSKYGSSQQGVDTAASPTDADTDTDSDTDADTDADSDSDTDTDTTAPTTPWSCADAELGSDLAAFYGTTAGASNDQESSCGGAGPDLALRWQAPHTGCFEFDTHDSAFDTTLALWEACHDDEIVCNDDLHPMNDDRASQVGLELDEGTELLVVVDGKGASDQGDFFVTIREGWLIEYDAFIGTLAGYGIISGNTSSTDTTLTPIGCPSNSGKDVILRWTPATTGNWRFELDRTGTDFDTVLSLHFQCRSSALACGDVNFSGGGEALEARVLEGQDLLIRIAGYDDGGGPTSGNYKLNIVQVP
jgi:hypothetical protein